MELKDTVEGMLSNNYKERLIAEYAQLDIRYKKARETYENWRSKLCTCDPCVAGTLQCPWNMLGHQLNVMLQYKDILTERLRHEGINVNEIL